MQRVDPTTDPAPLYVRVSVNLRSGFRSRFLTSPKQQA